MDLKHSDIPHVFLHTGDAFIGVKPTIVSTVLGSCVSISMFSARLRQGAICHAFLPSRKEIDPHRRESVQICRYVDTAVDYLLECMTRIGANKSELEVKMFGGSSGLTISQIRPPNFFSVGDRNVKMAFKCLKEKGLSPKAMDVGGNIGRKILFATHSGDIWMKRLDKQTLLKNNLSPHD